MSIYHDGKKVAYDVNIMNNQYAMPIGTIIPFGSNNIPAGYLICDGSEVLKTDYPELYGVIGNAFGTVTDSTKFKLPDLRNKFIQGANSNTGEIKEAGLPNITGKLGYLKGATDGNYWQGINVNTGAFKNSQQNVKASPHPVSFQPDSTAGNNPCMAIFRASDSNDIYGNSSTVQPPAVCINYIIKAKQSDVSSEAASLIDDSSDATDRVWSSSKVIDSTVPYCIIDASKDIDLNDYKEMGYYTPNMSFSTGKFTHNILNAPTNGWLPAGGFGIEVKNFDNNGVNWYTQVLYEYVSTDESAPMYIRTFFYKDADSGNTFTPWRRIADINDDKTSVNETWSSSKISSQISNGAIPQAEFDMNADINLNDYRSTGYWDFPIDLVSSEYKHTILNGPDAPFVPAGGFGLDVRRYGSSYCTQILYVYNNGNATPQTYQRCSFYGESIYKWTAWKKVAYST